MSVFQRVGLAAPGSGWVWAQFVLLAVIFVGVPAEVAWRGPGFTIGDRASARVTGGLLTVLAAIVLLRAWRDLGPSLTASPHPLAAGQLVRRGIYGRVRHPMYSGVLLAILGYAIGWGAWLGLAGLLVATGFLYLKSSHEERLLTARYPDYRAYREQVRARFIPGVL